MKKAKLWAACLLVSGLSHADTVWNPAANGIYPPATANWTNAANWTLGIPDFADKVSFANNAAECWVTSDVQATNISMNANAGVLRIKSGGTLTTTNTWSAVGYSAKTNTMIVEAGGTVSFGSHFWIGFSSTAIGIVDVNGGTLNVAGNMGLGFSGGTGTLKIRNDGRVNVSSSFTSTSIAGSSVIDIESGTLAITGDKSADVANYISAGKIRGYGGAGTAICDYNVSNPGKTTVKAIPGALVPNWKVVPTSYTTNELVIVPFDAQATFGIIADGVTDMTDEIQSALTALGNIGGGSLFLPSGHYKVSGNLTVPPGVTLRGEWQKPELGQPVVGTVLMAYAGRGDTNAAPFVELLESSGVMGLSIWYPEQLPTTIQPYPPTFHGGGVTVENVTLVNAYFGFTSYVDGTTARPVLRGIYGTPLKVGIEVDCLADIGRTETIYFSPDFWRDSGLANAPTAGQHEAWLYNNGTGMKVGRIDWSYSCYVTVDGYNIGFALRPGRVDGKEPNGQSYGFNLLNCKTGVYIETSAYAGYQFTRFNIQGAETGIYLGPNAVESTMFHSCIINATDDAVFCEGTDARVLMMSCDIQQGSIQMDRGYLSIINSDFSNLPANHIELGGGVKGATILGNRFTGGARIVNNALYPVNINHTPVVVAPLPAYDYKKPSKAYKPATTNLYVVTAAPYNAQANGVTDDTAAFQAALAAAKAGGGGTVFVPGGNYRLNGTLTVSNGVELRGVFDVQHSTRAKGSLLNVYSGRNNATGTPFIQLAAGAGLKGFTFHYPEQVYNTNDTVNFGMVPYPFLIRGLGADLYVINVAATIPYQLLDLATYRCDRHYIDYIMSTALKTGIYVGKGAVDGQIHNCQLNPSAYTHQGGVYPSVPYGTSDNIHKILWRDATPYKFGHMTNEVLHQNFVFGGWKGFHLVSESGQGPSGYSLGFGVDQCTTAMQIDDVGAGGLSPINSQIVTVNDVSGRYLETGATLTDTFRMFSGAGWGSHQYSAVINGGNVELQLFHIGPDGSDGVFSVQNSATLKSYGGNLDSLLATGVPFVTAASSARAEFVGNVINAAASQMPTNTATTTVNRNLRFGAAAVVSESLWSNGGGTRAWNTSANWANGVPTSVKQVAITNSAVAGPIIAAGTTAATKNLDISASSGTSSVDMTGGFLNSAEWVALGYGRGTSGALTMSGGAATVGGNLMVGLNGAGSLTMSGGSLTVTGAVMIAVNPGSTGIVSLVGGSLTAGSLQMTSRGRLELDAGVLILNGNVTNLINSYIQNGWMAAIGVNPLSVDYNISNAGKTTIAARPLVTVPNVIGQTQTAAGTTLINADLVVGTIGQASSETAPAGQVIGQSIAGGSTVTLGSAVDLVISSGYPAVTTTTWTPAGSGSWTNAANWTGAVVPLRQTQNLKVVFNVEGALECVMNTSATVAQLILGDNGTTNGNFLRLVGGANLYCGLNATNGTSWTAVGYNRPSVLTVETGAVFRTAANLLVGFNGTGNSRLNIQGGTVNVATTITLGNTNQVARGFITVETGGLLTASSFTINNTNCVIDVRGGTMILNGNQTNAVNGYIASGTLKAYGGTGTFNVDYNTANPGKTTVAGNVWEPVPVAVPSVTGLTQSAAVSSITNAGLTVGSIASNYNSGVAAGLVYSQTPGAGTLLLPGLPVDLAVSKGPQPVTVPNVVGQTQAAAQSSITNAGLVVGTVTSNYSGTAAVGNVISQTPAGSSSVAIGSSVNFVVSLGVQMVTVPNVVNQPQAAARTSITGVGLVVGTVTSNYSSAVAAGNVISQNPSGGSSAAIGSSVNFVVSLGVQMVTVPNVVNQTQTAAQSSITSAGLTVGTISQVASETVAAGIVMSQNPSGSSSVATGSAVALTVSSGYPAQTTTVWSPSGVNYWTNNASWTGGAAPIRQTQNLKVVFNANGAPECVLSTGVTVAHLVMGDNGTTNGNFLRLKNGADLYCGINATNGVEWTAVGYNRAATLTVETGAVFEAASSLYVGYLGSGTSVAQPSYLDILGGIVFVNGSLQLGTGTAGNENSGGYVTVDNGGTLEITGSLVINDTTITGSGLNIRSGTVLLQGDKTAAVNAAIASGLITAYGGSGTLTVAYNATSGKTTVTAQLPVQTATFTSVAAEDGYITESKETSNVGGTLAATANTTSALRIGDTSRKLQIKTVVSFDTSSLPDGAVIQSATLKLKRGTISGTVTNLGAIRVDIKGGTGFSNSITLQLADFQAVADATNVATMSYPSANGTWSTGGLSATGLLNVNKTGKTQLRVYLATDDDNDGTNDYLGFYSGDNSTAANRPILEITYQ